jgi:hypothetical protein
MAGRIIPFSVAASPQLPDSQNAQLLKAAKAAYSALLLAVPHGEKNTIVRQLGDALRACDGSLPPFPPAQSQRTTPANLKLTGAVAAQLLHELHSERCVCGGSKERRRPFCKRCYHSLPDALRAAMWLSPIADGNHLLDRVIQARAFLRAAGMLGKGGAA